MNYKELEQKIINSYTEGVTTEQAEGLAGEFLEAQIKASEELRRLDLSARLFKADLKEKRAQVFVKEATAGEKKPSDNMLNALVEIDETVKAHQVAFDTAEVERDEIQRMFSIFQNAHLHFRAIAKGKFE
jgi:hypothetical protein